MRRYPVAIIGSGFAGATLARILCSTGIEVVMIERGSHPRFAIGESSTPLAALALERLARRYDLVDLEWLAAHGRWSKHLPELRRGLKRGFTFYRHHPGCELVSSPDNHDRLLVAASPNDFIADCHWMRQDVDAYLVDRARDAGVVYHDRTELEARRDRAGWHLSGAGPDQAVELEAEVVIDASGAGGFLRRALSLESRTNDLELDTVLIYSHFEGLGDPPQLEAGPYPDQQAAVHHLLDEGWVYVLPFDHGTVSAGLVLRRQAFGDLVDRGLEDPAAIWAAVIGRYPTLQRQFGSAVPLQPLRLEPRLQRLLSSPAGRDWALLPHTFAFVDPMFSMGIAWSLLAVERLAEVIAGSYVGERFDRTRLAAGLGRYRRLLELEIEQMITLLEGAFLAMASFDLFMAHSFLYFSTVSFAEVEQRLDPVLDRDTVPVWRGFLAADDPASRRLFTEARERLRSMLPGPPTADQIADFQAFVAERIAPRNIAGLAAPERRNLYPVDLDLLIARAGLLGLEPGEVEAQLPLLRGVG